ncbi:MAG: FAD-dependent oxidoreductase [Candidatus Sumerlaeia bacterium]
MKQPEIRFDKKYDVIVGGAGVAGVAAALEAARSGLEVALVEKTIFSGGLATTGMVNLYLPLCDGNGRQVIFGIAEELLHLSYQYGPGDTPDFWKNGNPMQSGPRFMTRFSPASFILALDEILQKEGVHIWYDTLICDVEMSGDRTEGIHVENKSGRGILRADVIIDATGDADIAWRAGAECTGEKNFVSLWAAECSLEAAEEAVQSGNADALMKIVRVGGDNAGRGQPVEARLLSGVDGAEVSRMILDSRTLLLHHYKQKYEQGKDRHMQYPICLPAMADFRRTRRIAGQFTLSDNMDGQRFNDSIGLTGDWRKKGPVWEIPYGSLVTHEVSNLITAGRCISSAGDAWEVMRVIPTAALTGQIAGLAATLSLRDKREAAGLDAKTIQKALEEKKIPYHLADLPELP